MRKIICDSAAGLTKEFIKEHDIEVARLHVIMGSENHYDGEVSLDAVFKAQDEGKTVTTSQPTPQEFLNCIEKQIAKGAKEIVIFSISKGLSGTLQSATIAAGLVEDKSVKVAVVNTGSASVGAFSVIYEGARILNEDASFETYIKRCEDLYRNNTTILTIENLNTLVKTGRISKLSAMVGNLIKIKPALEMINDKVEVTKKFRGKDKIMEYMIECVTEKAAKAKSVLNVVVAHVQEVKTAEMLQEVLGAIKNVKVIMAGEIGPVLSVHLGRGGFGVGFAYES